MNENKKIRVLHVTEASGAGVGAHVLDLVDNLPSRGCDVHLAYSPLRVDKDFADRLNSIGHTSAVEISMNRGPHQSDLSAARQLKKYVESEGPFDVIHAHSTKAGGLCRIGSLPRKAKIVYTPNGIFSMNPMSNPFAKRLVRGIEKRLSRRSDAIIAVSPEEHEHMLEIGISQERLHMIPNGLRRIQWRGKAEVRRELGLRQGCFYFGFLGRLAPQKNPVLLLRAFARLMADPERVRIAMVGTGPLEQEARLVASQLGITEHVDWLGYKTAQQSMPAFDTFVMPSQYEGMPYVMMEAISLGLPVIATQVGGTSLGIAQGVNGFIVPCDDDEELASAMRTIIESPKSQSELSAGARQKASEFCVDLMVDRTLQVYQKITGKKSTSKSHSAVPLSTATVSQV